MSVRKRKSILGQSEEYHYEFMQDGKRYYGVCEGCTEEKKALDYEKTVKNSAKKLSEQKNIKALIENFRDELTGGAQIKISDGFELSLKKPKRRPTGNERIKFKRSYWGDFRNFMDAKYPDVKTIANVRRQHAEEYIQYLRDKGRFNSIVKNGKKKSYKSPNKLSSATINVYQQTLSEVFDLLRHDAGIIENPFVGIPKLTIISESREAFTEAELLLIKENMNDFVKPLFIIAIATALREGDICTLKWKEINFDLEIIERNRMLKTGHAVEIPIMPPLKAYLLELKSIAVSPEIEYSEYVLPEHAKMYMNNRAGVSYRIKSFLDEIGILTTVKPAGRSRSVSIKDLHSCRHTFCYYAGMYGIPLAVVQSIVGHMSPEMTKHYSAHATREAKRTKMELLPDFMGMTVTPVKLISLPEPEREELKLLADVLPIKTITKLLNYAHGVK